MVSTKQQGGTVINYSSRFSITGLTQQTPLQYKQAAESLDGSTNGPPAVGRDASSTSIGQPSATSSDTSDQVTSENSITPSATAVPTGEPTASQSATSPPTPSDGLSTGATAGLVAACVILGLALIAGLAAWFIIRRRRSAQGQVEEIAPQNPFLDDKAELPAVAEPKPPHRAWTNFTELSAESVVHEADSGERPPELDHMAFRAELEGSTPVTPRSAI